MVCELQFNKFFLKNDKNRDIPRLMKTERNHG